MEDMIPNEGLPKVAAAQPCCVQPYRSQVFTVEQNTEGWLCQCKKTKNPPYCDGSHNH